VKLLLRAKKLFKFERAVKDQKTIAEELDEFSVLIVALETGSYTGNFLHWEQAVERMIRYHNEGRIP